MKPILILPICVALSLAVVSAQNTPITAYLRVVNAAIATTAVDVYLDGRRVSSNVKFSTATDFLAVSAARHSLKITSAGSAGAVLLTARVSSQTGKYYTVALTGRNQILKPLVFVAQNTAPGAMTNVEIPEKPEPAAEAAQEERAEVAA